MTVAYLFRLLIEIGPSSDRWCLFVITFHFNFLILLYVVCTSYHLIGCRFDSVKCWSIRLFVFSWIICVFYNSLKDFYTQLISTIHLTAESIWTTSIPHLSVVESVPSPYLHQSNLHFSAKSDILVLRNESRPAIPLEQFPTLQKSPFYRKTWYLHYMFPSTFLFYRYSIRSQ